MKTENEKWKGARCTRTGQVLEEAANRQDFEDTGEMVQWRRISQEGREDLWKELCRKMEELVPEKYKVEEARRAYTKKVVSRKDGDLSKKTKISNSKMA